MFFLGGMTMGYLQPPAKTDREAAISTSIPAEKDRRLLETPEAAVRPRYGAGNERSLLWAWRTLV
ncbi:MULTISPECIES: hypothetical protein [Rhizobium]|uniref:Conserved protein n=1 Tax=Rhizobium favelukesii TaxID=348824 RepID=W6RHF4_9HYPH|nr:MULTISPECIES: hypothetical protein [Rhizobium]MCA0803824.1 hypothetical protein [Rhizobium sp. T1473]MCS0457104.1 hypothetical protein [Rhizobium favelukesii]UFS82616.1 hypothetical protein LPB79_09955 [Rhizobium sp. T136]CDM59810.1 putative conserved protein [Rhizobium favelukesii]